MLGMGPAQGTRGGGRGPGDQWNLYQVTMVTIIKVLTVCVYYVFDCRETELTLQWRNKRGPRHKMLMIFQQFCLRRQNVNGKAHRSTKWHPTDLENSFLINSSKPARDLVIDSHIMDIIRGTCPLECSQGQIHIILKAFPSEHRCFAQMFKQCFPYLLCLRWKAMFLKISLVKCACILYIKSKTLFEKQLVIMNFVKSCYTKQNINIQFS